MKNLKAKRDELAEKSVKRIALTKGYFAIVDADDFERVNKFKWYANRDSRSKSIRAMRFANKKCKHYSMHRFILNAKTGDMIDHINGNTLDNRKCNLRFCLYNENGRNSKKSSRNKTGFKGVCFRKDIGKFRASIQVNRKQISLGSFKTAEEAANAYDIAAIKLFGDFARTNKQIADWRRFMGEI